MAKCSIQGLDIEVMWCYRDAAAYTDVKKHACLVQTPATITSYIYFILAKMKLNNYLLYNQNICPNNHSMILVAYGILLIIILKDGCINPNFHPSS